MKPFPSFAIGLFLAALAAAPALAQDKPLELDPSKGHAVCKQKKNGGWTCDGPLQKVSYGKRPLEKALRMAGCKGPEFIGVWSQWQVFRCAQDVGRRDIVKKYNLLQG